MTRWAYIAMSVVFSTTMACSQELTGIWMGWLPPYVLPGSGPATTGGAKRIVVDLTKSRHGELGGMIYDVQRASASFAFTSVTLIGSRLSFTISPTSGAMSFVGTVSEDGNSIDGRFQGVSLELQRAGTHSAKAVSEKASEPAPPPEDMPAVTVAPTAESSALLARAFEKLSGISHQLLKYTCFETINRTYYSGPAAVCDAKGFSTKAHLDLEAEDRLRLEVAVAGGSEIHSWASANQFDSRSLFQIVSTGPISTGAFGTLLIDIFENPGTRFAFIGKKTEDSKEVFEYAFDLPLKDSHFVVKAGDKWIHTAYHGTFEVYSATAELARLYNETAQLPPETQMCMNRTITDYHYALIGDGQYLIPSRSEFDTISPHNFQTRSVTTFAGCHEYTAESSLVLDGATSAAAEKAAPKAGAKLPPGVSMTLALLNPIDTSTAAAGDAVSARVTKAVRAPGSNEVLIPAGAVAHGRILQMRHVFKAAQFNFAIRYDTVEQKGVVSPLSIELVREAKAEKSKSRKSSGSQDPPSLFPTESAPREGGSWFVVPAGNGNYVMAAGFESKWITTGINWKIAPK